MHANFSQRPGRHERHYRRKLGNPLFGDLSAEPDGGVLLEMQRHDHEELVAFLTELRQVVTRAAELAPNAGSDVVLGLKEDLDRLYETSAGLAEDHTSNQAAIAQLIEVVMRNVERAAGSDPQASKELHDERAARAAHFGLLAHPLVADLLHPQTTIEPGELSATLLSADAEALAAALKLFDLEQLSTLYADAENHLARITAAPAAAADRLSQIAARLNLLRRQATFN
ncbi:MAG: hypothetical protein KDJ33_04805 [Gammaproteobacteria bacterium]|nr:hypothetical protein [Gammaproteobacteria bacterium]